MARPFWAFVPWREARCDTRFTLFSNRRLCGDVAANWSKIRPNPNASFEPWIGLGHELGRGGEAAFGGNAVAYPSFFSILPEPELLKRRAARVGAGGFAMVLRNLASLQRHLAAAAGLALILSAGLSLIHI